MAYLVLSKAGATFHDFFKKHKITIEIGQIKLKGGTLTIVILGSTSFGKNYIRQVITNAQRVPKMHLVRVRNFEVHNPTQHTVTPYNA